MDPRFTRLRQDRFQSFSADGARRRPVRSSAAWEPLEARRLMCLQHLVESGHLEVRASPADRRVRLVVRTRLGDDTNRAVTARIRRIERQWARRVGPERYAAFRDVLETLAPRGQG